MTKQGLGYDKVSANGASSKPKTFKSQSGHRVVNKVHITTNIMYISMTYIDSGMGG